MLHKGFLLLLICLAAAGSVRADSPANPLATPLPAPKDLRRHEAFLAIAKSGNVDLLLLGDSITEQWRRPANKVVWDQHFGAYKSANFGIGGDGIQGVLWRIQNGELEGIRPKLVILLIGTNNIGDKPEKIAAGVKEILSSIQERSPGIRILLLGIFPRGPYPAGSGPKIVQVNEILATYAQPEDPKRVVFMDIGEKFLLPDRTVNRELMPDTLHLSPKGYQVFAEAIAATVAKEMQ